jgi:hypothetical protein
MLRETLVKSWGRRRKARKHLRAHNSLRAKWITERAEDNLNKYIRTCGLPDIIMKQMDETFLDTSTNNDVKKLNQLIAELRSVS